ncbi:MAG: hypothetical protein ACTHK6_08315 [Solirubrobacterales bacterium]
MVSSSTESVVINTNNNVASGQEVEDRREWRYRRCMNADEVEMLIAALGLMLALASFVLVARRTDWGGLGSA